MNWIPVDERLPDTDRDVLVCYDSGFPRVWLAHYCSERNRWINTDAMALFRINVTHWAEIPEPPQ